jgi:hypothetical protein
MEKTAAPPAGAGDLQNGELNILNILSATPEQRKWQTITHVLILETADQYNTFVVILIAARIRGV